jgi:hypothetical protein
MQTALRLSEDAPPEASSTSARLERPGPVECSAERCSLGILTILQGGPEKRFRAVVAAARIGIKKQDGEVVACFLQPVLRDLLGSDSSHVRTASCLCVATDTDTVLQTVANVDVSVAVSVTGRALPPVIGSAAVAEIPIPNAEVADERVLALANSSLDSFCFA